MAWIESHQDLATNPKTKRAARLLDVPVPQVIGHLHMLWWWTLDHAFDGDLSEFDALDIADAAGWDGDPDAFLQALIGCGPGGKAGFIDEDMTVHDWDKFTEHLRAKREASAAAHHQRWHVNRGLVEPSCDLCNADADAPESGPDADGIRTQDSGSAPTGTGTGTTPEPEPSGARKRATQLPDGWRPDDVTNAKLAKQYPDIDLDRELAQFTDHARSKGRTAKDWTAAWRMWVRKADEWRRERAGPAEPARGQPPAVGSPEWEARQREQEARAEALAGGDG